MLGPMTKAGVQRVDGSIGGRSGSFLVETVGEFNGAEAAGTWSVIPGSATGELAGLGGTGGFRAPHGSNADVELDHTFDPA